MKSPILKIKKQVARGFTLVELAIVMVIIGLLIGGVLRGQELINSARVSNMAATQNSIQTAYFGFIDRYQTLPGDLTATQAWGISNRTVASTGTSNDGNVLLNDSPAFFNNLAQAGFLVCTVCGTGNITVGSSATVPAVYTVANTGLNATITLTNVFNSPFAAFVSTAISGNNTVGSTYYLSTSNEAPKPFVTTGQIPSPMLAQIDRRIDDGSPASGAFRATDITGVNSFTLPGAGMISAANSALCVLAPAGAPSWITNPSAQCQGVTLY
jgi:prepilin-type N-terminal cleavage/methylation domain-containing protein